MSYLISVYSANAFKEFLLPAIDNADSWLTISGKTFLLPEDFIIPLEVVNGRWYIKDEGLGIAYTTTRENYRRAPLVKGDFLTITLPNGQLLNMIVNVMKNSFTVFKKFDIRGVNFIGFGKGNECEIQYDTHNLISRLHGVIRKEGSHYIVDDNSTNGIFINSVRMVRTWQLSFGDCIDVFGLRMVFLGDILAVNSTLEGLTIMGDVLSDAMLSDIQAEQGVLGGEKMETVTFHRSPRKIFKLEKDVVEIEAPPAPKEKDKQPLSMAIGPSLTMALPMLLGCSLSILGGGSNGGIFMYTGIITAVASAAIGTTWTLVNLKYNKKKNREEESHRFEVYGEYLIKCADQIKAKYDKNISAMWEMYPSAESCCEYTHKTTTLWNRNVEHEDMFFARLGVGDIPFQVAVNIPKETFSMINDALAEKPAMIRESYKTLHGVPVGVDLLQHRLIGMFGGEKKLGAISVLHAMVCQIAANNCYTDVKMAFVYDEKKYEDTGIWSFAKWLPHVWSEDKKTRYVAKDKSEASDVFYELAGVFRQRQEEAQTNTAKKVQVYKPHYILFLADMELLEGELISKYVFSGAEECGLTTLLLAENYEQLPNACKYLIQNDSEFRGAYGVEDDMTERQEIKFDIIAPIQLDTLARRLSNIEVSETETGGEMPNALTFFEMHGVNNPEELNVIERWRKNRTYDSMKALVGQKSGGVDCYLDVHEKYHGPHGLVAGTTGSGKSETLQTYMLSLAINFSPDDVGFFVIDYKGGGMANLFSGLPHLIGQISNLSGNQVRRAMVSIKSENMRRQRVFNEHGVNNINLYTKLYKNNEAALPVPHMFIIIDEFAELKREEPDFMRELISVAQVGRSLGVHLILATQKPSGTVDDNIWSNSKFKLCLRVQDRQDSNDMLHKPDAAYITQAGRCYLQVGNDELYELFQSGYSGAVYDSDAGAVREDIAKMLSNTGKAALVGSRTKLKQKAARRRSWIRNLALFVKQSGENVGVSPVAAATDPAGRDKLTGEMFRLLEADGIEYPYSEYNAHRLEDMVQMYALASEQTGDSDYDRLADKIIELAGKAGKKLPEMKEKTQLDAVIEHLAKTADENGYDHNLQLWLPVLPTEMYLDELEGYEKTAYVDHRWPQKEGGWGLDVYMGLCDDPVNQAQMPMIMDLAANGNHAVCGTIMSGKSTFLQTFVYSLISKYTPDEVNVYGIDYGSKMLAAFEKAPHVGGMVYEGEDDRIAKLFTMLVGILDERKAMFRGGNYSQYVQANGVTIPAVVVVADGFGNFRAKTDGKYDDLFVRLTKEGVGYGVYVVVAAAGFSMSEIPNRIGDNIRTSITLEMGDKFQYADAMRTMRIEVIPEENVKGRGLVKVGDSILEYQTALTLRAEDDFKRSEAIAAVIGDMRASWKGKMARPIPEIPKSFVWSEFAQTEGVEKMLADDRHVPVGYDAVSVAVYGVNLSRTYCYTISGKTRTGKTNMLKVLMQSAAMKGGRIVTIDFTNELEAVCGSIEQAGAAVGVTRIADDETLYNFLAEDLMPEFKDRNVMKHTWIGEGLSDDEVYENMQAKQRIFIFIANMAEFISHIYNPAEGVGEMAPAIENFLDKGMLHNIFWFGCIKTEDSMDVVGRAYDLFLREKNGAYFGGNVADQRIFAFDNIPYSAQSKTEKPGIALLPLSEDETVSRLVVPLNK